MLKSALIIDDDPAIVALIMETLSQFGFICAGASNAAEALQFGRELKSMDLIITDIKMPLEDGFQLIHQLKEQGIDCPMVAVTGLPDKGESLLHQEDGKQRARPLNGGHVYRSARNSCLLMFMQ